MNIKKPIVLVDDDEDDYIILSEIFEELGVKRLVRHFRSGAELIDYLTTTSENPFIILCDINMPKDSGLEARKTIEANPYLKQKSIPFIFYTSAVTPREVIEAYELTVQGFFSKPSDLANARETIKIILEYWYKCIHPNQFGIKK